MEENKENYSEVIINAIETNEKGVFLNENNAKGSTDRLSKLYNIDKFEKEKTSTFLKNRLRNIIDSFQALATVSFYLNLLLRRLPIINVIRNYSLKYFLLPDILSGFTGNLIRIKW